jgi:hypothetical protein
MLNFSKYRVCIDVTTEDLRFYNDFKSSYIFVESLDMNFCLLIVKLQKQIVRVEKDMKKGSRNAPIS